MRTQNNVRVLLIAAGVILGGMLPLMLFWPSFAQPLANASSSARTIGAFQQWLLVLTAYGLKPTYMAMSLGLIIWLWTRVEHDLTALRWGLVFFLGGEVACAANYLLFGGNSAVTDYLHSYGMAVGFAFMTYAFLEGLDLRIIKYTPARDRCAALSLCRSCIKYSDVPCGLRRMFSFVIPAMMIVSTLLLCSEIKPFSQEISILNSRQQFSYPMWAQVFESRYCAWIAIAMFMLSWTLLLSKRDEPVAAAKIWFAAAMGPLSFGLMRLFLRGVFGTNLPWANIWEEVTEFLFIAAVGLVLWMFRGALFKKDATSGNQREAGELNTTFPT